MEISTIYKGVFSVAHKPEILFSKPIELKTKELPRFKPHITITRRMVESDEEQ
ncbi:MAG: hypothetical protein V7K67_34315 [Nostoc sp.]